MACALVFHQTTHALRNKSFQFRCPSNDNHGILYNIQGKHNHEQYEIEIYFYYTGEGSGSTNNQIL